MTESYHHQFVLDKSYYRECFEQSESSKSFAQLYTKALIFIVLGIVLVLFTEINDYAAWFIFSLGILEVVAQHYRKAWWVTRQMLSKEAKSTVELRIDEQKLSTKSYYHQQDILWQDVKAIKQTSLGYIISYPAGTSYLSKKHLNSWAENLILARSEALSSLI